MVPVRYHHAHAFSSVRPATIAPRSAARQRHRHTSVRALRQIGSSTDEVAPPDGHDAGVPESGWRPRA
jgi:hypothetical protein